jgi:hypothetical protein
MTICGRFKQTASQPLKCLIAGVTARSVRTGTYFQGPTVELKLARDGAMQHSVVAGLKRGADFRVLLLPDGNASVRWNR